MHENLCCGTGSYTSFAKITSVTVYRITCYCGVRKILRLEPLLVNLHFVSPTVTE
jgi:hypothetical protein